jgi:uncharacterized protein (DUF1015 family)
MMPTTVMPFAGWRYNPQRIPALDAVMTPPYDVIRAAEREAYLASGPYSMIHLILGAEHAGDDDQDNRFTRAATRLRQWQRDGVLQRESAPALYLYQQDFVVDGHTLTRSGFMARVRLVDYEERVIFPHETTFAGPKADLLRLWQACQANLSQIFAVYLDASQALDTVFEPVVARPPQCHVAHWGEGQHRLWAVTDADIIRQVQEVMRDRALVIADGHHRYETALALRQALRQRHMPSDDTAAHEYVMMYCANIHDPGVVALPTHRLLHGVQVADLDHLLRRLGDWIHLDVDARGHADLAQWQQRLAQRLRDVEGQGSPFAVYGGGDRCYILSVPAAAALQRVKPASASDGWKQLDVSVLHHALLPALEGLVPDRQLEVTYARAGDDVLQAVADGRCDAAIMMRPTSLEQMVTVAMGGERMPQKSTYFYPKLPTGLVLNGFDV